MTIRETCDNLTTALNTLVDTKSDPNTHLSDFRGNTRQLNTLECYLDISEVLIVDVREVETPESAVPVLFDRITGAYERLITRATSRLEALKELQKKNQPKENPNG